MLRSMDFFRPDLSKYICDTCTKILRRPTQLQCCGRRVCKTCVQLKCPGCGTKTNEEFEDKHFMRIMDNNEISCYSSHCDWTGKISAYQDHYDAMHMEMSEEHDRGVPEPGFIGTTVQDSNFIYSDDFAQVPENENPTPQDEGPSSDSSSSYQSVPDSMFDDDTAVLGTVSCHVVPSSVPGAVFEADRPPNVLVCGECGEEFSSFDTYESHRSSCHGSLLHYNGPSYSMPSNVSQESLCRKGNSELLISEGSKSVILSQPIMITHEIKLTKNGHTVGSSEAPFSIADYEDEVTRCNAKAGQAQVIEFPSTGDIHWKITNIPDVMNHHESILSPCFHSLGGHMFRLQLNIIRQPSIQLLVVSGENDAHCQWPIECRVSFGLLNFGKSSDIYVTIPSVCCTRSYTSGNSVASTILPQNVFDSQFVKEDNLFANCSVFTSR